MSYQKLIRTQVKSALRIIGTLGVDATLEKEGTQEYSFGSGEVTSTGDTSQVIRLVVQTTTRSSSDNSGYTAICICDSEVVGQLDQYDNVTFGGNTWKISGTEDNGYITTLTLNREA